MAIPWYLDPVTAPPGNGRNDVSIGMPVGTPIYAPVSGIILGNNQNQNPNKAFGQYGFFGWGGQVDILTNLQNFGKMVIDFIHFDKITVKPGQYVQQGDLIGYSGGENTLSTTNVVPGYKPSHTTEPRFSTGPHIGLFAHTISNWSNNPVGDINLLNIIKSNSGLAPNSGYSMASQLSYQQIEIDLKVAGFPNSMIPLMAAIAEAESGGNPGAVNPTDNGGTQSSYGLFQISTGNHNPPASNWADPVENAKLAFQKYKSQGLGAWGTYNSGAYKQYLPQAQSAYNSIENGSYMAGQVHDNLQGAVNTVTGTAGDIAGSVAQGVFQGLGEAIASPFKSVGVVNFNDFMWRAAFIVLGLILIISGAIGLLKNVTKGMPAVVPV